MTDDIKPSNESLIAICHHCGNRVPLVLVIHGLGKELYEESEGVQYRERFGYSLYQCPTCEGISLFGDFVDFPASKIPRRLYPEGSDLLPPSYKLSNAACVPPALLSQYEEILPLRHTAPSAFAASVRRALEFICHEKGAEGNSLFAQLQSLVSCNVLPGHFEAITDLMRKTGNRGAHLSENSVDRWDAELLNDLFRLVVEYVYITPARITRLKQRLETSTGS